jgi:hypothetical protein
LWPLPELTTAWRKSRLRCSESLCSFYIICTVYSIDNKHTCTVVLARKGLILMFKVLLVTCLWIQNCTLIKKKIKFFKTIQKGAVTKSYMTNGLLIFG